MPLTTNHIWSLKTVAAVEAVHEIVGSGEVPPICNQWTPSSERHTSRVPMPVLAPLPPKTQIWFIGAQMVGFVIYLLYGARKSVAGKEA